MLQRTLRDTYTFEGKGLHTGVHSTMRICPAPENTGIRFRRVDLGEEIDAVAENVSSTARSTTISNGRAEVHTIEHVLSALTGMGVDNALVELDVPETPILDGSASFYVKALAQDGLREQNAERKYLRPSGTVEMHDEKSGAWVKIEPADRLSYDIEIDFGSKVLGVQTAHWDETVPYDSEIGICRTFVFFHEIEYLFANNLIKGGDVDNAIVIVEHPVSDEQLQRMSASLDKPALKVDSDGYLNNLSLHFPNECGRHKLLDLIGDLRLCGGFLQAKVTAFKPGHTINTKTAKAFRESLKK